MPSERQAADDDIRSNILESSIFRRRHQVSLHMTSPVDRAKEEGRVAVGKSWRDCPYGHDQQELREGWCKARLAAEEEAKPLLHKLFFGRSLPSVILGWVIFLVLAAAGMKLLEVILGCVNEFGRRYC